MNPKENPYSIIVVSDIHIKSADDHRAKKLSRFLLDLDLSKLEYLVLLGDIFDFCFGASRYFKEKYMNIGKILEQIAESGVKVIYVQGNHEFSLDKLNWKQVKFVLDKDELITSSCGTKIAISHGDQIYAPWHYKWYLAITRSRLFEMTALLVPAKFLDYLCLRVSDSSRSRNKRPNHKSIINSINHWLDSTQASHGVVGHFHVPYEVARNRKNGTIYCLDSWDKPNVLGFRNQKFERMYI